MSQVAGLLTEQPLDRIWQICVAVAAIAYVISLTSKVLADFLRIVVTVIHWVLAAAGAFYVFSSVRFPYRCVKPLLEVAYSLIDLAKPEIEPPPVEVTPTYTDLIWGVLKRF